MSPEIIQIVLPLTFLGICGLVGEILVQGRRDKAAENVCRCPLRGKRALARLECPQATADGGDTGLKTYPDSYAWWAGRGRRL